MIIDVNQYLEVTKLTENLAVKGSNRRLEYPLREVITQNHFEAPYHTESLVSICRDGTAEKDKSSMNILYLAEKLREVRYSKDDIAGYLHTDPLKGQTTMDVGAYIRDGQNIEKLSWLYIDQYDQWLRAHRPDHKKIFMYDLSIQNIVRLLTNTPAGKNRVFDWYNARVDSGIVIPEAVALHKRMDRKLSMDQLLAKLSTKQKVQKVRRR